MSKFEQLNTNINTVMERLLTSQDLCKLLYYTSYKPFEEQSITNPKSLLFKNLFPLPKVPSVDDAANSFITVLFDSFRLGDTMAVKEGLIRFNIICHVDLWKMSGGLRPFAIMSEIDKLFNDERVIGMRKLQIDGGKFFWVNDNYSGYQLSYQIVSAN